MSYSSIVRDYCYYEDPENTRLVACIRSASLENADRELWNNHKRFPLDLFLFIRVPPIEV